MPAQDLNRRGAEDAEEWAVMPVEVEALTVVRQGCVS